MGAQNSCCDPKGMDSSKKLDKDEYDRLLEEYHRRLNEWTHHVAAIEAEEQYELKKHSPGCCRLSAYWCQNGGALCCETPCRVACHALCCSVCCCGHIGEDEACPRLHSEHHKASCQQYMDLTTLLWRNIRNPSQPELWLYTPDVKIHRPPKPQPPTPPAGHPLNGSAGNSSFNFDCNCGNCCNLEKLRSLSDRYVRSLYCAFGGCESFHLAACCGPMCWCTESIEERDARWDEEYDKGMAARTDRFMKGFPQKYDFLYEPDGSVLAIRHGRERQVTVETVVASSEILVPPYTPCHTMGAPVGNAKSEEAVVVGIDTGTQYNNGV